MSELILQGSTIVISIFDLFGFEVHFIRMVYLTLIDHSVIDAFDQKTLSGTIADALMILLVLTPVFFFGIKYLVAPAHLNYPYFGVSLTTPIPLICLFFYESLDVLYLAIFVVVVNLYVSWRLMEQDDWSPKYDPAR